VASFSVQPSKYVCVPRCRTRDPTNEHVVLQHATVASIVSSDVTMAYLLARLATQLERYARTRNASIKPTTWKLWRLVWQILNVNCKHLRSSSSSSAELPINHGVHLKLRSALELRLLQSRTPPSNMTMMKLSRPSGCCRPHLISVLQVGFLWLGHYRRSLARRMSLFHGQQRLRTRAMPNPSPRTMPLVWNSFALISVKFM